jgi:hypothetical protein
MMNLVKLLAEDPDAANKKVKAMFFNYIRYWEGTSVRISIGGFIDNSVGYLYDDGVG